MSGVFISRIQVEEGFLDGLDLTFTEGHNVLIGARGAGKTSVIELIRFCLGVPALTERASETSREHALSILGSGRVTVTLNDGKRSIAISRTAEQVAQRTGRANPSNSFSERDRRGRTPRNRSP